ncbi:MAG: hypothetical protein IT438_09525 [Phycisphaerales bacterium]|nr:hypothetical protein [Phycisphaerales bacterium]
MSTRAFTSNSTDPRCADRLRLLALLLAAGAALSLPSARLAAQPPAEPAPSLAPATPATPAAPAEMGDEGEGDDGSEATPDEPGAHPAPAPAAAVPTVRDGRGRRVQSDEPTVLAFKSVGLDQILPFIVETTGKVVVPQRDVMTGRNITVVNDAPLPREEALELVIFALQQNGIGAVETDKYIILRAIEEIDRQDVPVIGPDESVLDRKDIGFIYSKVYALHHSTAENIHEIVKSTLPPFAKDKSSFDAESNQILVMGNIGLLQRIESLVKALDQASSASLTSETFKLNYADAESVATNIKELFSANTGSGNNRGGGGGNNNPFTRFFQGGGGGGGGGGRGGGGGGGGGGRSGGSGNAAESVLASSNLRVTANVQQNSVTVMAERPVIERVREHILHDWDRPLGEDQAVPKIYDLKNSDPIKVRDIINSVLNGTGGTAAAGGNERGGNNNNRNQSQGAGRLAGQFSVEAVPEASRLVVLAKSPDNIEWLDKLIDDLDQPQSAGLPKVVELKHASAEELAEQLNTLLAQESTIATLQRQESGLTAGSATTSPFAADAGNASTTTTTPAAGNNAINFWWSRARIPTTTAGVSNLVGKIRIVPVWRQNALMLLSPPEYQHSLGALIEQLDKPGRQVLLAAVIAEVSLEDATALGLRWSNSTIIPTNQDNAISIGANAAGDTAGGVITGTKNNLLPSLFDTSVLNVGVDLNVLLQALNEKTNVNILSEPRIFTSDNQEATFFNGQDVPFVTDSQTTDNGTVNNTFDYKAVGINLRVRPRITVRRDVDLNISLQLSSISPSGTSNGSFIIDRRQTDTHLIVKDGQTVVLSGILRTEDSDVKRKVPLLGDLPLIGYIFQSIEKSRRNSEVVAFITPFVIENDEEADTANQTDRVRLKELREMMRPAGELKKAIEQKYDKAGGASPGTPSGDGMDSGVR